MSSRIEIGGIELEWAVFFGWFSCILNRRVCEVILMYPGNSLYVLFPIRCKQTFRHRYHETG